MTDSHDHRPPAEPPTRLWQLPLDDQIVAVIDDEAHADGAIAELEAAGVAPEDIWHASGEEMRGIVQGAEERESEVHRVGRAIAGLVSDEGLLLDDYLEKAGTSGHLLFVRVGERRREIEQLLRRHRAHDMRYFGRWTIEDLP